ncbi:DMT family transporter [Aliirhizobium smilacinae]|uniref:DMT family transporter n=1 Tax=Aliirhizobium smilacinae TaxID=1395944 RepID=A0A5C4XSB2_9HYPH|nr:DMT family transporter [Rhizobium smilacinae]TNM65460.1 DMT family transporter [Rhizobium smilacinae]
MFQRSAAKGVILSFGSLALLGVMPVISNSRPAEIDALTFAFALSVWQTVFAAPVVALETRRGQKGIFGAIMSPREGRRVVIIGLLTGMMFGLSTYLYVLGTEMAGAANAAIALQAYPLFAILLETVFLGRRKNVLELGLTLGLCIALYYIGTGGTFRMAGISVWFLLSLGVPFLWSIAHVLIKEELARTPITPAQVTFFRVLISTIFLAMILVPATTTYGLEDVTTALLQPISILMGLVYYLELMIWFYAVRHIDVSLASSITTPWPALTMIVAAAVLGDRIEAYQIGAFVVVVICVYALSWAGLKKQKVTP